MMNIFSIHHFACTRVGFLRSLIEMVILGHLILLLSLPLWDQIGSPWLELLSYLALLVYPLGAWRLGPGRGGLWRRLLRTAAWVTLFGLVNGILAWAIITLLPWKSQFLGMQLSEVQIGLGTYIASAVFLAGSLFLPVRLLLAAWGLGQRRLRWRLTFSYLLIGILTLVFAPLALLLYVAVVSLFTVPTLLNVGELAPRLAVALAPSVRAGATPDELDRALAGLLDGTVRVPLPAGVSPLEDMPLASEGAADLTSGGVRRLSLLSPSGLVLASVGRDAFVTGGPLAGGDADRLRLLVDSVRAGEECVQGRPGNALLVDSVVCPIADADRARLALLLVESNVDGGAQVGAAFGRIVAVTLLGASLMINLVAAIVIALLPVGLGVGYLLASGLTRRIERLASAAGSIASGDLERQVPIDTQDEIGMLGADFNAMAGRLAEREQALSAAAARAEELLRANKRLVADVSHELRNPLATLRGHLEALVESGDGRLPARDLRVIQAEADRLTALVEDLFTLARVEAQQLPMSLGPVDVGPTLAGIGDALAPLARREREIELVTRVAAAVPAAWADRSRLEQVIRNLIQNALRHTPPGGIIALGAEARNDGRVAISVADTGLGIAAEDLPHIFERFYRGDSSRARETGGAGLGLALVRELVTAMGGEVEVESTPGRGSRFSVILRSA